MKFSKEFKEIRGDASSRKFFRNKRKKLILVYTKKNKEKDLLRYDAINKILIKNKILAPRLIKQNYKKNFIEIEDLGNETIFQILKKKNINSFSIIRKIIRTLKKMQNIKDKKIKNFKKKNISIQKYKKLILFNETKIFCDWYSPRKLPKKMHKIFNLSFKKEIMYLLSKLNHKNETFVHRDFHVSNLIYKDNNIGLIDNQDALIGNRAYDLASLVDDVRLRTSDNFKSKVYNYFLRLNKDIDSKKFKNDFEILSVLRNLKIIGIFYRLAYRDKKKKYLKLIPYAWEMIFLRMSHNNYFYNLEKLIRKNFPYESKKL